MAADFLSEDAVLDPDSARERLTAWKGRIDQLAADTKAMSDRLEALRITVADDNRIVEVTVDSAGALVDLRLGRQIQRIAPDVVAHTIMNTIRQAKLRLADRAREIIGETVGTDSPAARAIAERVGQRLRDRAVDPDADAGGRPQEWR